MVFRYYDEIIQKYNYEKDQLQFKLESIKDERLQSINERIDNIYDKQKQLKFYVQVPIGIFQNFPEKDSKQKNEKNYFSKLS